MSIYDAIHPGHRALDYHLRRHNVLASNVANADTPGFRPLELVRELPEGERGTLQAARTHAAHRRPGGVGEGPTRAETEQVVQPGGDGNAVSLEREMAKVAANDLRFQGLGRMVKHHLGLLRYAASDGHG